MEFLLLDGFLLALAGGHFVCELYIYNIEYRGGYAIRIGLRDGIKRRVRGRGKDGRERERGKEIDPFVVDIRRGRGFTPPGMRMRCGGKKDVCLSWLRSKRPMC